MSAPEYNPTPLDRFGDAFDKATRADVEGVTRAQYIRPGATVNSSQFLTGAVVMGLDTYERLVDAATKGSDRSPDTEPRDDANKIHDVEAVPLFTHDCEDCVFLRHFKGQDLYFHGGNYRTVIARRSNKPEDYVSGIDAATEDPNLAVAFVLAARRGFI